MASRDSFYSVYTLSITWKELYKIKQICMLFWTGGARRTRSQNRFSMGYLYGDHLVMVMVKAGAEMAKMAFDDEV